MTPSDVPHSAPYRDRYVVAVAVAVGMDRVVVRCHSLVVDQDTNLVHSNDCLASLVDQLGSVVEDIDVATAAEDNQMVVAVVDHLVDIRMVHRCIEVEHPDTDSAEIEVLLPYLVLID